MYDSVTFCTTSSTSLLRTALPCSTAAEEKQSEHKAPQVDALEQEKGRGGKGEEGGGRERKGGEGGGRGGKGGEEGPERKSNCGEHAKQTYAELQGQAMRLREKRVRFQWGLIGDDPLRACIMNTFLKAQNDTFDE